MKLIAIDLDGTLLNSKKEIKMENINSINKAIQNNIHVIIATGRSYHDAKAIINSHGLNLPIISDNGSAIHDENSNLLNLIYIKKDSIAKICESLEEDNYYYEISTNNKIYSYKKGKEILTKEHKEILAKNPDLKEELDHAYELQFSQNNIEYIDSYEDIVNKEDKCLGILGVSFYKNRLEEAKNKYKKVDESLSIFTSTTYNFEMTNKEASKGNALKLYSKKYGYDLEDSMAIGDNGNDFSMIESVGFSFAMKNAIQELKEIARYSTLSNEENGVSKAIEFYLKENKIITSA
ncbi:MAG: Cof-type HAD-IIB family hydrolase [Peptostreptococcaceae bacterium]|jgi:Cof subfamily protein (haloacid dehalogenase superfamily)|nr:Cof-type HAD-IIB family hydrolase [Peptostreptococcaceae bacterium]